MVSSETNPARTRAWSSATATRMVTGRPPVWAARRAPSIRRPRRDRTAAFPDRLDRSSMPRNPYLVPPRWRGSATGVSRTSTSRCDAERATRTHAREARMTDDVGQALLHDPKGGQLEEALDRGAVEVDGKVDVRSLSTRGALDELGQPVKARGRGGVGGRSVPQHRHRRSRSRSAPLSRRSGPSPARIAPRLDRGRRHRSRARLAWSRPRWCGRGCRGRRHGQGDGHAYALTGDQPLGLGVALFLGGGRAYCSSSSRRLRTSSPRRMAATAEPIPPIPVLAFPSPASAGPSREATRARVSRRRPLLPQ